MEHDLRLAGQPRKLVRGVELSRLHDALWARAYELLWPVQRRQRTPGDQRGVGGIGAVATGPTFPHGKGR
jgi:hypothetical protein